MRPLLPVHDGSIPASAGKPRDPMPWWPGQGVYPRVRGEARAEGFGLRCHQGLSPRPRGSPGRGLADSHQDGSIPASAGKPWGHQLVHLMMGVYPRVRGEAFPKRVPTPPLRGLSPRPRGSRSHRLSIGRLLRSIPASAGKPGAVPGWCRRPWVYPRVRGEATVPCPALGNSMGLSPRPRGSLTRTEASSSWWGSIPASAGKPRRRAGRSPRTWVYPRVRGEAWSSPSRRKTKSGLSPRPRGSPLRDDLGVGHDGSIPASAGKPRAPTRTATTSRVYPRVRGEAFPIGSLKRHSAGLSPRPRGSRIASAHIQPQ